jgi:hypothetical protein
MHVYRTVQHWYKYIIFGIPVIHIYIFFDLRCVATTLALITHNSNYNDRDIRFTFVASTLSMIFYVQDLAAITLTHSHPNLPQPS